MLKRMVLTLATIGSLLSGVGMVSAYEAYTINVVAHVENALLVRVSHIDMGRNEATREVGSVFPEEWIIREFKIEQSASFCDDRQRRVVKIDYSIFATDKPNPAFDPIEPVMFPDNWPFFPWLGDALYIADLNPLDIPDPIPEADKFPLLAQPPGKMVPIDPPDGGLAGLPSTSANGNAARPILVVSGSLNKGEPVVDCPRNTRDTYTIGMDVPVFEGSYNEITDVPGCLPDQVQEVSLKKPSRLCVPSVILTGGRVPENLPDGITLGLDFIIQVTCIGRPAIAGIDVIAGFALGECIPFHDPAF